MSAPQYLVVAALVRRDDQILLVCQQGPDDPEPGWTLPGGVVDPGELLTEALAREVCEETGLVVDAVRDLVYVAQLDDPTGRLRGDHVDTPTGYSVSAVVFNVSVLAGKLLSDDPDALVTDARFFALSEAITLLERLPRRVMREPIVAYLRGETPAGAVWLYRRGDGENGAVRLVTRVPG